MSGGGSNRPEKRNNRVDRLNREINAGLADSKIKARFAASAPPCEPGRKMLFRPRIPLENGGLRAGEEHVNHGGIVARDV
jgi:hypothetical protein